MFQSIYPVTLVKFPICVSHGPKTFPFTVPITAFVSVSIRPSVLAFTVLLILTPLAIISFAGIGVHARFSFETIIPKISLEHVSLLH